MFFGGLPGGSPGPDASCSIAQLVGVVVFAAAAAALMLWFMFYVAEHMALPFG